MTCLSLHCKGARRTAVTVLLCCGLIQAHALDPSRSVTATEYTQHLEQLDRIVASCQARQSADTCNPSQVGTDDQVRIQIGGKAVVREVRYGWLRLLLDQAGKKEESKPGVTIGAHVEKAKPVSISQLLNLARQRLSDDEKEAGSSIQPILTYDNQRKALAGILSQSVYRSSRQRTAKERFQEWLDNALNDLLGRLVRFGSRQPWLGFVLRAAFLLLISSILAWVLIRFVRQSRIQLVPEVEPPANSPSARQWQLWLADARAMAASDHWREAIHFVYWAVISRLEGSHVWPADRARTPREYLQLIPQADPRRVNLGALTGTFERVWYGGREADANSFHFALKLASLLGVE